MQYLLEFFLIIILQALGVGFAVGQKVRELDKKSPNDSVNDVLRMFWQEDRFTIAISFLILCLDLVVHLIIAVYSPSVRDVIVTIPLSRLVAFLPDLSLPYLIISFILAFLMGFFGQKLFYKLLGKLEGKVNETFKLDQ